MIAINKIVNGMLKKSHLYAAAFIMAVTTAYVPMGLGTDAALAASPPRATSISTGATTACAVIDNRVKCWGSNSNGELGNNSTSNSLSPVSVYTKAAWTERITCSSWDKMFGCNDKTIQHPATALHSKDVSKVSVGTNHACAIAKAILYCWGKNDKGQLGNGAGGWLQKETSPVAVLRSGASALKDKEVVDVSAGDDFTCALASDGMVACWGEGDNGRLGNDSTGDKNIPVAVYSQAGSTRTEEVTVADRSKRGANSGETQKETRTITTPASVMHGRKGTKLAKASATTMCVLTVNTGSSATSGSPVCWGKGIDGGQGIPGNKSDVVTCNKDSPRTRPSATTKTTIFESKRPTLVPGVTIAAMDGQDYITGLGADNKTYYWGMYGYQETVSYANVATCRVNPCTGKVTIQKADDLDGGITLAWSSNNNNTAQRNSSSSNKKNKTSSNALSRAQSEANARGRLNGGVASVTGNGNRATVTYKNGKSETFTTDDSGGNSCNLRTHYGFTKNVTNNAVGQKVTTTPPSWPQSQAGITAVSGNVYNGLFCAASATGAQCDAHGTSQTEGQTGSGFAQTCKFFSCSPAIPTGPQQVVTTGWLAGKAVSQLSTGSTGYTCAIASGSVGCWGVNTKGQLGVGDKKTKNIPTEVGL